MTPRVVSDEDAELDAMAARDEDPREAAGYSATTEPRLRKPPAKLGHWAIGWVEGAAPSGDAGPIGGVRKCRDCPADASVLHADPRSSDQRRVICGACQGRINRDRIGWASAKEPSDEKPAGKGRRS